ncbi:prolipoprotein diacylglyceryl transferase family protein, partial [Kibdelosporangium lantanae]
GIPLPVFADAVAPGIVVAQAIGRIGNYFNQELYGAHTDLPWGMEVFQRINTDTGLPDQLNGVSTGVQLPESPVHPTFLYELIWNLLVALLVVLVDRKMRLGHGRAFALYVAGYTLGRTWIEMMRSDEATHVFGVRINVFVSIIVFLGALVYFFFLANKGPREDLATLRATTDDGTPDAAAPETPESDEKPADPAAKEKEEDTAKVPAAPEAKDDESEKPVKPETGE